MHTFKLAPDNRGYRLTPFCNQMLVEEIYYPSGLEPGNNSSKGVIVISSGVYLNELQGVLAWLMSYDELAAFLDQLNK